MGQGVLQSAADAAGLKWELDSAGTYGGHSGEAPDVRARQVMREHGMNIDDLRARQVVVEDFERFDLILAMDDNNYRDLVALQGAKWDKVRMFLPDGTSVPDPYYGDRTDFEKVLYLLRESVDYWTNQSFSSY
jgi:protein-tyrosine phosphatase